MQPRGGVRLHPGGRPCAPRHGPQEGSCEGQRRQDGAITHCAPPQRGATGAAGVPCDLLILHVHPPPHLQCFTVEERAFLINQPDKLHTQMSRISRSITTRHHAGPPPRSADKPRTAPLTIVVPRHTRHRREATVSPSWRPASPLATHTRHHPLHYAHPCISFHVCGR
eukprot:5226732-Prymnesium_polylepis.1